MSLLWLFCLLALPISIFQLRRQKGFIDHRLWLALCAIPLLALAGIIWFFPSGIVIQKTIAFLVMPAGLLWLALLLACFFPWHAVWQRFFIVGLTVFYTGIGNEWVGNTLMRILEAPYKEYAGIPTTKFDAIVILGGGTGAGPENGKAQFANSGDRVGHAAACFHAGATEILIPTGQAIKALGKERDLSLETSQILQGLKVPEQAILRLNEPRNTSEELAAVAQLMKEKGWTNIGLVTSAWHMGRAMSLARKNGLNPTPIPADFRGSSYGWHIVAVIPKQAGLQNVERGAWEIVGRLAGR